MTNPDSILAAHDHVIKHADQPYMTWGATAFYLDRCVICGRLFQRERPCVRGTDPREL